MPKPPCTPCSGRGPVPRPDASYRTAYAWRMKQDAKKEMNEKMRKVLVPSRVTHYGGNNSTQVDDVTHGG